MSDKKLKGIEGLPLKYIVMILMGAIVIAVFLEITLLIGSAGLQGVSQANQTLTTVLNKSIGNVLGP